MIRVIGDAGSIFIDERPDPLPGGTLQATLDGTRITISNIHGGQPIVCADASQFGDAQGNPFASAAEAMAYLSGVFAPAPQRAVAAVCAVAVEQGQPLALSRATGQFVPARSDTYAQAFVAGLALADAALGFVAQAGRGALTLPNWTAATGSPLLAVGQPYFLAPTGGLTTEAALPGAICVARIGLATAPATLMISPSDPILL